MRARSVPLVAASLLLGGCTMIPRYSRPPAPVPDAWPESAAAAGEGAPAAADVGWREFFTDPRLRSTIELALANNRDLRVASLNVEKAGALYRIQRGEAYPGIGAMASGEIHRLPEKMTESGEAEIVEAYSVHVGVASWEPDFFGRIRSLKARALEQYLATEQAHVAGRISLIAGTATAWLVLAADLEGLGLARSTLETQQATLDLIRRSRDLGMVSDLDLRQAESQVETARAAVARLLGLVAVDRNMLDLLVGTPVAGDLLPDGLDPVTAPGGVSPGLPSEVLLRRPDILLAEHRLKAANANIGAARAAFFPSITLTAGFGTQSAELSDLFGPGTRTWTFAPSIVAPIFAGGSLRANLRATEVEREIAVAEYEKAIQTAFAEVGDALTLRKTLAERRDAEEALVRALEAAFRLSDARYRGGLDGYLGVLIAQRSLFAAQQALVGARLAEQANLVTLYKVLGGGA